LISYLFLEIYIKSINQTLEQSITMCLSYFALKMGFRVLNGLGLKQMPNLQGEKSSLCRVIFNYGFYNFWFFKITFLFILSYEAIAI